MKRYFELPLYAVFCTSFMFLAAACSPDAPRENLLDTYQAVEMEPVKVMVLEEDDEVFFGTIGSLAADSKGNVFVTDRQMNHIIHFDAAGNIVGTLGREGRGPGEFESMTNMFVARDTLYVYDHNNARIGSFTQNAEGNMEFITSMDIEILEGRRSRGVLKSRDFYVVEGYTRTEEMNDIGFVALLNRDGSLADSDFLPLPAPEQATIQQGDITFSMSVPFGRRSHYRLTPDDHFYYAWNDSLAITMINIDGEKINTIKADVNYRPVTSDVIRARDFHEEYLRLVRDHIPETKPAFDNFLVDEDHRVWVNLGDIENEDLDKWIILDQESNLVGSFDMVQTVTFYLIRDGKLYGINRDEDEIQTVVVYDFV